jgi:hypothetical protein
MRKTTLGFVLAFAVVWFGYSANQHALGLQRIGTLLHRVNSDTKGCRTVDGFIALANVALTLDYNKWRAALASGDCTTFHKGDRVVLELWLVDTGGVVKIHRPGETASYYTFAVVID